MDLALLYDDCPNHQRAEENLTVALTESGAGDVVIRRQRVSTVEEAERLGFLGSPTILIDGVDPFAEPGALPGLSCRVHRTEDGPAGAPTVAQLGRALAAHTPAPRSTVATSESSAHDDGRHPGTESAMTSATDHLIERGLRAWTAGDLDALEAVLDPAVTLRWVEPGDWDCTGRDEVMRLLRQRRTEGNPAFPVTIERLDERSFIVSSTRPVDLDGAQPFGVATRVTVAGGRVIAMQQYRAEGEGLPPTK